MEAFYPGEKMPGEKMPGDSWRLPSSLSRVILQKTEQMSSLWSRYGRETDLRSIVEWDCQKLELSSTSTGCQKVESSTSRSQWQPARAWRDRRIQHLGYNWWFLKPLPTCGFDYSNPEASLKIQTYSRVFPYISSYITSYIYTHTYVLCIDIYITGNIYYII